MVASTLWNGQDAVDQAWKTLSCTDKNQLADVLSQFLCWMVLPCLDSRILHQKGATCARGGVLKFIHFVNNDAIMHAVHTCTVAFSTQS